MVVVIEVDMVAVIEVEEMVDSIDILPIT